MRVSTILQQRRKTYCKEGNGKNDIPSGEGTFSVNDSENNFSVKGKWKKGKLNGSVQTVYSDGSYTTCSYSDGKPYGRISEYSSSDQLTGYDFYYQMRTVSSLKEKALMLIIICCWVLIFQTLRRK